ncbi:MAG: dienelactone hydrolase family protein [Alphaproteobacteria bacterium]
MDGKKDERGSTTLEEVVNEAEALIARKPLSRRGVAAAAVAAGCAAAAGPVAATAIITDTEGLETGMVKVPVAGGDMAAYRARPEGVAHPPVIIVIQEIFGVHEWIKDVCRRFAKQGWYAIAGELYFRQGNTADYADTGKLISELVSKVPDAQVWGDLDSKAAFAEKEGGDMKKVSVTGFCWGGRQAWMYAAHNPKLKAGVAWYGSLVAGSTPSPLRPRNPVDVVRELKVPVLGLYGGKDRGITPEHVERMRQALKEAGNRSSRIDVFPGSGHGFLADYRESYNERDAKEAWNRALAWLRRHGAA